MTTALTPRPGNSQRVKRVGARSIIPVVVEFPTCEVWRVSDLDTISGIGKLPRPLVAFDVARPAAIVQLHGCWGEGLHEDIDCVPVRRCRSARDVGRAAARPLQRADPRRDD